MDTISTVIGADNFVNSIAANDYRVTLDGVRVYGWVEAKAGSLAGGGMVRVFAKQQPVAPGARDEPGQGLNTITKQGEVTIATPAELRTEALQAEQQEANSPESAPGGAESAPETDSGV